MFKVHKAGVAAHPRTKRVGEGLSLTTTSTPLGSYAKGVHAAGSRVLSKVKAAQPRRAFASLGGAAPATTHARRETHTRAIAEASKPARVTRNKEGGVVRVEKHPTQDSAYEAHGAHVARVRERAEQRLGTTESARIAAVKASQRANDASAKNAAGAADAHRAAAEAQRAIGDHSQANYHDQKAAYHDRSPVSSKLKSNEQLAYDNARYAAEIASKRADVYGYDGHETASIEHEYAGKAAMAAGLQSKAAEHEEKASFHRRAAKAAAAGDIESFDRAQTLAKGLRRQGRDAEAAKVEKETGKRPRLGEIAAAAGESSRGTAGGVRKRQPAQVQGSGTSKRGGKFVIVNGRKYYGKNAEKYLKRGEK